MTGKTHAACGVMTLIAITLCTKNYIPVGEQILYPAIGLLSVTQGSYMPDIDLHRSRMGSRHKFISKMLTHRGITHTLLVPVLLLFAMTTCFSLHIPFLPDLIFGFEVGWVAHIAADLCNRKGVPILWPLTRHKFHIACFLTSSWHEVVFLILWGLAAALISFKVLMP